MVSLPESSENWPAGVYQIETTDPVLGGADGVCNQPAKDLANRTAYLKARADMVDQALPAGGGTLADRLAGYDAYNPDAQSAVAAGISEALHRAAKVQEQLDDFVHRRRRQGEALITNKFVMRGFSIAISEVRALHVFQEGAVGSGVSVASLDGIVARFPDTSYALTIPTNEDPVAETYYVVVVADGSGGHELRIEASLSETALELYRLEIPGGDIANNLDAVTLTDVRAIQLSADWVTRFSPTTFVSLNPPLATTDYTVSLELLSATDLDRVGELRVVEKVVNGFEVGLTGSADNVHIRWSIAA